MSSIEQFDYIDEDVAYLLGLITARGTISESGGIRRIVIEFPYQLLEVQGISVSFDTNTSIRLGLQDIQSRITELTGADVSIVNQEKSVQLVIQFLRKTMVWRNILMHTNGRTSYEHFMVPEILFSRDIPISYKREYIRGFADVAGNVRYSNRYTDGANRVRLDVLNYPTNWEMPVQLCTLIEEHLAIPVQLITWGHPNLGRDFREHQINIFAVPFGRIGFSLPHKQRILEEFIESDQNVYPNRRYLPCLGRKTIRRRKPKDRRESDKRLDERIRRRHFDAYWQICKKLGCPRNPESIPIQMELWDPNAQEEALEEDVNEEI